MMQVAKKIPFDDPNVLNICRAIYVASNVIILSIYIYIKTVVDKKKGMSRDLHSGTGVERPNIVLPIIRAIS
jgi:hypothetical protein